MARMPMHANAYRFEAINAGLAVHLLKYVLGSVWQGQRLLAVGGVASVARFVSSHPQGSVSPSQVALWWLLVRWRQRSALSSAGAPGVQRKSPEFILLSGLVALAVFVSGALVGLSAGLDPWWFAGEVSGARGLGVAAVSVPAGLGIRELFRLFRFEWGVRVV